MRKTLPLIFLFSVLACVPATLRSQPVPFTWTTTANGTGSEIITDIVAGKGNYIYACGHFSSASVQLGSLNLTGSGGKDILVAKYDTAGNLIWAKAMGGAGQDEAVAIATDSSDNI